MLFVVCSLLVLVVVRCLLLCVVICDLVLFCFVLCSLFVVCCLWFVEFDFRWSLFVVACFVM